MNFFSEMSKGVVTDN